jgi:translation initiation factor 4G
VADEVDDRDWRSKPVEPLRGPAREFREAKEASEPQQAREPRQQQAREPQQQQAPQQPRQPQPQQQAPQQQQQAPQQQAPQQQQQQQQQQARPAASGGSAGEAPKIVRAADVGLQAYRPGATVSGSDRALRQIKGILNKLTPEKFERLLDQLLQVGCFGCLGEESRAAHCERRCGLSCTGHRPFAQPRRWRWRRSCQQVWQGHFGCSA